MFNYTQHLCNQAASEMGRTGFCTVLKLLLKIIIIPIENKNGHFKLSLGNPSL